MTMYAQLEDLNYYNCDPEDDRHLGARATKFGRYELCAWLKVRRQLFIIF
jgi:hypothetical protein